MIIIYLLVIAFVLFAVYAFVTTRPSYIFYRPNKCKEIIKNYTGSQDIQILRALSDGTLKFKDIRSYYNYGHSGIEAWTRQEYLLICNISDTYECVEILKRSGTNHGKLHKIELSIDEGKAIITKHWVAC